MSGVGRPAGQRDKAPRKSRGGADRARALARAASSAGPGASLASFLSHGGSAGSSGDAPAAAPAVAAPPDAEMEETTVVEEPAPGSGGLPSGPPGAPRPPDLQPDPVVPEARPGTDGGDQEEADAAGHDAGAADGPEQRADPERLHPHTQRPGRPPYSCHSWMPTRVDGPTPVETPTLRLVDRLDR